RRHCLRRILAIRRRRRPPQGVRRVTRRGTPPKPSDCPLFIRGPSRLRARLDRASSGWKCITRKTRRALTLATLTGQRIWEDISTLLKWVDRHEPAVLARRRL